MKEWKRVSDVKWTLKVCARGKIPEKANIYCINWCVPPYLQAEHYVFQLNHQALNKVRASTKNHFKRVFTSVGPLLEDRYCGIPFSFWCTHCWCDTGCFYNALYFQPTSLQLDTRCIHRHSVSLTLLAAQTIWMGNGSWPQRAANDVHVRARELMKYDSHNDRIKFLQSSRFYLSRRPMMMTRMMVTTVGMVPKSMCTA